MFWLYLLDLNIHTSYGPAILLQDTAKKNIVYTTTKIHIEWSCSVIYNSQKQKTTQMPTNNKMNKLWYIHVIGYDTATEKVKLLHTT